MGRSVKKRNVFFGILSVCVWNEWKGSAMIGWGVERGSVRNVEIRHFCEEALEKKI
jgi:hypothetical protein